MKKILIITNHSYMLWQFRRELIQELAKTNEVVLSMPFVGHEADFQAMGLRCIHTELNRRGINPVTDLKLMSVYRHLLREEKPDLVITYSIKPNLLRCCTGQHSGRCAPSFLRMKRMRRHFRKDTLCRQKNRSFYMEQASIWSIMPCSPIRIIKPFISCILAAL